MIWDYEKRLDDLMEEMEALIAEAVNENGELDPEVEQQLMDREEEKLFLEYEREQAIEGLCLSIKNMTAEAKAIREEEKALAERRQALEKKTARREAFIQRVLAGEKFRTSKVNVTYRKTSSVETAPDFIAWAENNRDDLLRYKAPDVDKTAVKAALKNGEEIPFATIIEKESMSIK